jgi:predicted acylesterase/phospholipase RssA
MATSGETRRQIRFGLVLNGGVSLAVWIGGVTLELDNLRRAAPSAPDPGVDSTSAIYRELLEILEEDVIVDVIAGASAGGINGVLLATAIYNGRSLPNLRETWIGIGDFQTLLRSPGRANPPSLMQGDAVLLPEMERLIDGLYESVRPELKYPLYLYVTATDLFGYERLYHDSTGRAFEESDSRRRLAFWSRGTSSAADATAPGGVMRAVVSFSDPDAQGLLAAAARSTSSFPVAFEAHRLDFFEPQVAESGARTEPRRKTHWMIDGGVLDNQPFNPVLDRISVIRTDQAVGRVVAYVVPYVNEPGSLNKEPPEYATARQTMSAASSLPRDVSRLESLDRVTAESQMQAIAEKDRRRIWEEMGRPGDRIRLAAESLFPTYRRTRYAAALEVWNAWAAPDFIPGEGVLGQDPALDPRDVSALFGPPLPERDQMSAPQIEAELERASAWVPRNPDWDPDQPRWDWGLAPAERVAAWALLFLDDVGDQAEERELTASLDDARSFISQSVLEGVRLTKSALYEAFRAAPGSLIERADAAFRVVTPERTQAILVLLDETLADLRQKGLRLPRVADLLHLEIVRNALSQDDPRVAFPFRFMFMSAGIRNSLGHCAMTPGDKLAGMKLGHFGGFLKRSWRANDWLWGRLDGVEHVLRTLLDLDYLKRLCKRRPDIAERLADTAFNTGDAEVDALTEQAWRSGLGYQTSEERRRKVADAERVATIAGEGSPREQFFKLFRTAIAPGTRPAVAGRCIDCCRAPIAARIQLVVLEEDLERVAVTAAEDVDQGGNKEAGSVYWSSELFERNDRLERTNTRRLRRTEQVELFKQLRVGEEKPSEEADSRLAIGVVAQIVGVAGAMVAGDRGGLPLPVRSALASVRGITLPMSALVRLTAREPWVGAALVAALTGLVLWIALSKNALLGALFPALALIAVALWLVLFTIATSLFEESLKRRWRWLGFALLAGIPLAFGIFAGWPEIRSVRHWLDQHLSAGAARTAAVFAFAATGLALLRLAVRVKRTDDEDSRRRKGDRRRKILSWYRPAVLAALLTFAGGFIAERWIGQNNKQHKTWTAVANEHRGTLLVAILLGVLFLAAVAVEIIIPALQSLRTRRSIVSATTPSDKPPRRRGFFHPTSWWFNLATATAVAVAMLLVLFLMAAAFFVGWVID